MAGKISSSKLWSDKSVKEKIAEIVTPINHAYKVGSISGENYLKIMEVLDIKIRDEQNKPKL
jgi:hypothetical protein